MIVVTFFVVVIPCSDSSPKLPRSFPERPRRVKDGNSGRPGSGNFTASRAMRAKFPPDAEFHVAAAAPPRTGHAGGPGSRGRRSVNGIVSVRTLSLLHQVFHRGIRRINITRMKSAEAAARLVPYAPLAQRCAHPAALIWRLPLSRRTPLNCVGAIPSTRRRHSPVDQARVVSLCRSPKAAVPIREKWVYRYIRFPIFRHTMPMCECWR
jgi:hypothetical protein